jgi:mercuric ion transport protein
MDTRQTLWASALAAIGASLCCVAPLVLVILGIGGAWIATLTRLEPARPYFVVLTLGSLALAGRKLYQPASSCKPGKSCAGGAVLRRQRFIFWLVAIPLLLLLAFPWYAALFY